MTVKTIYGFWGAKFIYLKNEDNSKIFLFTKKLLFQNQRKRYQPKKDELISPLTPLLGSPQKIQTKRHLERAFQPLWRKRADEKGGSLRINILIQPNLRKITCACGSSNEPPTKFSLSQCSGTNPKPPPKYKIFCFGQNKLEKNGYFNFNEACRAWVRFSTRSFFFHFNPCGLNDQLVVFYNFAKNGWAKRSKKREAKLRVKISKILIFDAKLRFAVLASLRSAIFSEIKLDN